MNYGNHSMFRYTLIRAYSTLNEKENATSQNSNTDDPDFFKFILRQLLSIKVFSSRMLTNASKKDDPKNIKNSIINI